MAKRSVQPVRRAGKSASIGTSPVVVFAIVVALCLAVAVGYVAFSAVRSSPRVPLPGGPVPSATISAVLPSASGAPSSEGDLPSPEATSGEAARIVFQNVNRDNGYGQVAVVPLSDPGSTRTLTGMTCERVHFAAGQGVCLVPEFGVVSTYYEVTFDAAFQPVHRLTLNGAPTRARISPDGRYGAATVFVFWPLIRGRLLLDTDDDHRHGERRAVRRPGDIQHDQGR